MGITELIRRVGATKRVVEHAEARGLLAPAARTTLGHKLYGPEEEEKLRLIVGLYGVGFSVARIKAVLSEPAGRRKGLLDEHGAFLQRQAAEAEARLRRYDWARAGLEEQIERVWRMARRPGASTNEGFVPQVRTMKDLDRPRPMEAAA